ncbi:hypothetical protein [Dietzia psychralcaliphila]|uniref:hypothetical protein n=1 Tax=Dietzia psychralcaliphila TaxID=139021 RepID=UPI0020A65A02|nr:hypothetical protein [Dietzia psychralcaliphila]
MAGDVRRTDVDGQLGGGEGVQMDVVIVEPGQEGGAATVDDIFGRSGKSAADLGNELAPDSDIDDPSADLHVAH